CQTRMRPPADSVHVPECGRAKPGRVCGERAMPYHDGGPDEHEAPAARGLLGVLAVELRGAVDEIRVRLAVEGELRLPVEMPHPKRHQRHALVFQGGDAL